MYSIISILGLIFCTVTLRDPKEEVPVHLYGTSTIQVCYNWIK